MKIMIIDDNKQLREGIRNSVDWQSLGIHDVKTAQNGEEGLEIFRTSLPDIVLLDIMMPEMNGLEFLKLARQIKPEVKVLIISGHSEFTYAVEAMKYGASGYELKPLKMQQLMVSVSKLVNEIRLDSASKKEQGLHRLVYQDKLLADILHGYNREKETIEQLLGSRFDLKPQNHVILLCAAADRRKESIPEDLLILVEQLIRSSFKDRDEAGVLLREKDRYYIFQKCSASMLEQMVKRTGLATILRELNELIVDTGITLSGGISNPHCIYDIHDCHEEAAYAVKTGCMAGAKKCRPYEARMHKEIPAEIFQKQKAYLDTWEVSDHGEEQIVIKIQEIFRLFREYDYYEEMLCLRITTLVMERIRQYFASSGCSLDEKESREFSRQIEKMESIDACEQLCREYLFKLNHLRQASRAEEFSPAVRKVREYVGKHYAEGITVAIAAEHIGKSPNYLSHIFKSECGITFSEFLNATRIQKAKELIRNSDMMIYEVAEAVGYSNYIHFTQVFKKYEGCSPTQLRKNSP